MAHKTPVIVTIGKSTEDVFLKSSNAFTRYEHKGVKYEQLPVGKKLDLDEVIISTGGNVTNAAVTFARQGLHSKYAWCIGTDASSNAILQILDKESLFQQQNQPFLYADPTGVSRHFRTECKINGNHRCAQLLS